MICGIDPGKTGAIAFKYSDGRMYVEDMPVIGKEVNAVELSRLFKEFTPKHVFIEDINSFGMGRQSAFNFGQGLGVINGVLAGMTIPFTRIRPAMWKKYYHLNKDKSASRAAATRLFPGLAEKFKRVNDDGRAEAVLIAHYGASSPTIS